MSNFQAALFFEAARDTTIHSGPYTVPIKALGIVQVAYVNRGETADDARKKAVCEIDNILVDGHGSWFISVYEQGKHGGYKQLTFESVEQG